MSTKLFRRRYALLLVLPLAACEEPPPNAVVPPELEEIQADNVIYGFEYLLTREGVREAVAFADEAYVFEDSTIAHLHGNVRLVTYDRETGQSIAEVLSDWGRLNQSNNALLARGNARLTLREEERRIESAELNYQPDRNRIWSDSASVMFVEDRVVEGSGFESDLQFDRPVIRNARTRPRTPNSP